MAMSTQGLPATSRICPVAMPSCAAALGAKPHVKASSRTNDPAQKFPTLQRSFMPHSPLPLDSLPVSRRRAPIISELGRMPSSRPSRYRSPVRNWIRCPGFGKRPQAQQATVASATSCIFALIAGPRQMQRGPELDAAPNDLALLQRDHRSDNFDSCFRACTGANQFLKCPVILGPAVRVAGAILGNGADVDNSGTDGFRPTHCY